MTVLTNNQFEEIADLSDGLIHNDLQAYQDCIDSGIKDPAVHLNNLIPIQEKINNLITQLEELSNDE